MNSSQAYRGFVTHVRHRPKRHRLKYRLFYLLLDLGDLAQLDARLTLFGYNRAALFSFHDGDHGARDGTPLRAWVSAQLAEAGIETPGGRVLLMCLPRLLGYVFNPLSVYFCYDAEAHLRAVLYEVCNTFGEAHTYVVPIDGAGEAVLRHSFDKAFYVSPFIPMDCAYEMAVLTPGERISVTIAQSDADGALLAATFSGAAQPLTDRFLAAALLRYPLVTLKVIAGIHWEALKLWCKRIPMFRHPAAPAIAVSIVSTNPGAHHGRPDPNRPAI